MSALTRRTALSSLPAAGAALAAPAVAMATPHPDAELIRLGAELDRLWAAENQAYANQDTFYDEAQEKAAEMASDATSEVVAAIERLTATTFEGFKAQAKALSWCLCGETEMEISKQRSTDILLAERIIGGLLKGAAEGQAHG